MMPELRLYTLRDLPAHLAEADEVEHLRSLLTTFDYLQAKIGTLTLGSQLLIDDYDLACIPKSGVSVENSKSLSDPLRLIQDAIRLSAHILVLETMQLAGQLLGRLLSEEAPEIQGLLEQAKQWKAVPWLRPLTPSLISPDGSLLRTLSDRLTRADKGTAFDTWPIYALAATPSGEKLISASLDTNLKIWDLLSGEIVAILEGHTEPVKAVAVFPDGERPISASEDMTLKVWTLQSRLVLQTLS